MGPRNPTEDVPPDFLSDDWEAERDAIIQGGKSAEEAAEVLLHGWRARYEKNTQAWNEHLEQCRRDNEEEERRQVALPDNDFDDDEPPE